MVRMARTSRFRFAPAADRTPPADAFGPSTLAIPAFFKGADRKDRARD
jgi:hypothetical protein